MELVRSSSTSQHAYENPSTMEVFYDLFSFSSSMDPSQSFFGTFSPRSQHQSSLALLYSTF
jgi:hypothetical protein